jgi:serine/threonine-protein kinase
LSEGSTFHGRYQIVRCIKAGGMGAVYEALHLETLRRRALKVMLPSMVASAEMRERFKLEATVAAEIDSDHIVETFDAGIDLETGVPFLVMELLRGEDLSTVLERRGRLPADEAVHLLAQAAKALDKTHAAGIVHRDLKPDNLFLAHRNDEPPRLKILDFGIAKVIARVTETRLETIRVGTPAYMAPEQTNGTRIGSWTDLYALGHIAYTLLVGEEYWTEDLESQEVSYPVPLRTGHGLEEPAAARAWRRQQVALTPEFEAWFAQATAMDPAARFTLASTMVIALAQALGVEVPVLASRGPMDEDSSWGPARIRVRPVQLAATVGLEDPDGGTAAPLTSDWSELSPSRSRRLALLISARVLGMATPVAFMAKARRSAVLAVAGVATIGLLSLGAMTMRRARPVEASPASVAPLAAGAPAVSAASSPDPARLAPVNAAPRASKTAPVPGSSVSAATGSSSAKPGPSSAQTPAKGRLHRGGARPVDCNPPFAYDAAGVKHYKAECF